MRLVRGSAWFVAFAALAAPAGAATPQILAHGEAAPEGSPVVRTAANGDLVVLWSDGTRVRAAFRLNGGPFLRAHAVPGLRLLDARRGGGRPLLTTSGHAIVAWPLEKRMLIATAPRGGPFAVPQAAPIPQPFDGLAFSPDGHGAILGVANVRGVSVSLGEPDGRWGGPQRLTTDGANFRVAVGDGGGVIVAWTARGACGPRLPLTVTPQCEFVRVAMHPAGGAFGPPVALDTGQYHVGSIQTLIDAAGRPVVAWRRTVGQVSGTVLARGSFTGGFAPAAALPGTDRPVGGPCAPHTPPEPRVAAVRSRPDGGAFVLVDRDEGCGPLLDEVPLGPDGTAGAPVRLTATPLAPKLGVDLLGLGGRTPALVTRTAAGAVAVARTAPEAPFAAPIAVALPARARRGPTAVLPDGRVVVAFSRACRPGAHVSEAVVVAPGRPPSRCA